MLEAIGAAWVFVLSIWLMWPVMLGTFILCLFFLDDDWQFFSAVFVIVFSLSIKSYLDIPWSQFQWYLYAYLPVGMVWSLHRYRRYLRHLREKYDQLDDDFDKRMLAKKLNDVTKSADKIVYWVYAWPLSALTWTLKDVIDFLKRLVTVHLRRVYERVAAPYRV